MFQSQGDYPIVPKSLAELVLPEILTASNENFVLYDNGSDAKDRIIIFGTEQMKAFLMSCDIIHMDGTVSSAPALFNQIYVIHGMLFLTLFLKISPQNSTKTFLIC